MYMFQFDYMMLSEISFRFCMQIQKFFMLSQEFKNKNNFKKKLHAVCHISEM